ncbi:hypothetical protein CEXT_301841 [Caerostris extrusa]|uniref:Uncharacterized protein n=1 Tax=Caerostris extrusa TaxID=172846 RepID=A0AAV4XI78_CAEEX|nr:hypothetical protein CEXT_301841 [Caerostris extrusa]
MKVNKGHLVNPFISACLSPYAIGKNSKCSKQEAKIFVRQFFNASTLLSANKDQGVEQQYKNNRKKKIFPVVKLKDILLLSPEVI